MTFNFITGEVNSGYYRFGSDFGFEEQKEFPEQISYTAQRYECYENECYEKYNKEYKLPSGHSESYIDCTSQYFKDISGIEVLADSEVGELWKRYKYGDKNAFDKLVIHNLKLVVKFAKEIKNKFNTREPLMDLIQAGNFGLIRAVEKYDYNLGYAYSTYASYWIKHCIMRYLTDLNGLIRIPSHMVSKFIKINNYYKEYEETYNYKPTTKQVADELKIAEKDILFYKRYSHSTISTTQINLESDFKYEYECSYDNECIDPVFEKIARDEISSIICNSMDCLQDKEKYILSERYGITDGDPKTLDYLGNALGVSRERIRQLERRSINKIKRSSHMKQIENLLN